MGMLSRRIRAFDKGSGNPYSRDMHRPAGMAAFILLISIGSSRADLLPTKDQPGVFVVPGQEGMHRELIPKGITIVRCYYDLDVVAPGTTFGFDINGSGFDESFYKIISIDPDALDVTVKNLRLVTANQIHGQIDVGTEATTQHIHLKVIIRALPVFRAPEPFGVVRKGEVLSVDLTAIDETGQWGRFRVITNLDDALFSKFHLEPTHPRLEVSNVKAQLPFYVDGVVMISDGLKHGRYGLVASLGKREIFRQDPLVNVVLPNVGKTGSIEKVKAVEMARRPGDTLELNIIGSAFTTTAAATMVAQIPGLSAASAGATYVSAGRMDVSLPIPANTPVGIYGVVLLSNGKVVQKQQAVFAVVPADWLASVKLASPLTPGQSSQLLLLGRDLSPEFAKALEIQTDKEGLKVSGLRRQDASTLIVNISAAADVEPGDYIIHVSSGGKPLNLPRGGIIKVTR